ncbi:hypothetical protein DU000_10190 [Parvibium lacunae]|uniref:Uncharacterized protein n=2 Tax=Parvibium lacunae TaxID=1888893 RepID=A0A368L0S1_9BURK|nr:hypothetical protein DU000_10190 [Parvibium lacunae]
MSVPTAWVTLSISALYFWQTGFQPLKGFAQYIAQLPLIVQLINLIPQGNIAGIFPASYVVLLIMIIICGLCWSRFHHHQKWLLREDEQRELNDV